MTRVIALFAAAVVFLGVAVGTMVVFSGATGDPFVKCRRGAVAGGTAAIGGPFTLTGATGARVSDDEVITKPTLIYFGFTFCPDICPTDLSRNAVAADLLEEQGIDVGQVFITIDPARDTPEAVGQYAQAIHPELIGLSGSEEDVAAAANAYRVYFSRGEGEDEFYLMDHSTFTYLVAPEAGFLEFYGSEAAPEEVAESVACYAENL